MESGDVFQIIKVEPGREGWLGAFVIATDIKPWGIIGFVHHVEKQDSAAKLPIRCNYDDIVKIGHTSIKQGD